MKTNEVKAFFERTDVYLTYNYNLRIRAETIGAFIGDERFDSVLDMPCGTGDISAPFISSFGHLTMMDFSENMIATARTRIDNDHANKVDFVNADFYGHDFMRKHFDLVMNIGILAHIEDPMRFLDETMSLVKPGGKLILQNTDSDHWFAKLIHTYLGFRRLVGKDKYKLNKVRERDVLNKITSNGFYLQQSFRYNQSFLGFSRLFSNDLKYKLTRKYFGFAATPKNQRRGSDVTYLFVKR
ncbi:MAG: class I SAM-dependent methyltransferase [Flavobacteriales bacterium]|nr:class I SAM-dependent methyltransferase [Flavobacteriales bacterium]